MPSDFIQEIVFTDQAVGGITAKKLNISWRDNKIAPAFVSAKPPVGSVTSADFLLVLKADNTYAKVPATAVGSGGGGGGGDMTKAVYDANNNSLVDHAELADAAPWTGITGKPSTFAPSPHASTHLAAGSDPIAIATAVLAGLCPAVDNTTIQIVASKLSCVALAWTAITGKPSTFPPDSTAMLKSVYDTNADNIVDHAALADIAPWAGITGVPSSFAPSAHAASHLDNGTDPIAVVTTTRTGLAPKLNGNAGTYLNGTGAYSAPAGGGDMLRSVYDTNGNNVVDTCDSLAYSKLTGAPAAGTATPLVDGTAAVGTSTNFAREDHVHPSDTATIWSARLRSFNAIQNPNFEVDQRNAGTAIANNLGFVCDRWLLGLGGTMRVTSQQATPAPIAIPGTNYTITNSFLRLTLTTAQATLAAADSFQFYQAIEGPQWRELFTGPSSVSLLVYSSVATTFSISIRTVATAYSFVHLCTVGAGVWTLITIPNIPVFPANSISVVPGQAAGYFTICLGAGSTYTAASADTWLSGGSALAAPGTANWSANPVNTQFIVGFVQHEPNLVCTPLMDLDFATNLQRCKRYYYKTHPYGTKAGAVASSSYLMGLVPYNYTTLIAAAHPHEVEMAKNPTITIYSPVTGAAGAAYFLRGGADMAISSPVSDSRQLCWFSTPTLNVGDVAGYHYVADTGW